VQSANTIPTRVDAEMKNKPLEAGSLRKAARLLQRNPRLLLSKIFSKIRSLKPLPPGPTAADLNGVAFDFDFSLDPAVAQMYRGCYQVDVVEAMKRFLCPGGVFIDAGANIGYLSAIAMGLVGKEGEVHAFEPVPECADWLRRLSLSNPGYRLFVRPLALGDRSGKIQIDICAAGKIGWNTAVPNFMEKSSRGQSIEVEIVRLDSYLKENRITRVSLIKIDCEGYEFPILKGLEGFFKETPARPPIVSEIAPAAYPLLGVSLEELRDYMSRYGYQGYDLQDFRTPVDVTKLSGLTDVAFLAAT
jgi:FkbM family methyltransferase